VFQEEERKKHRLTQTRELLVEAIQKERTDPQQEGEGEEQSEEESDESDEEEEQVPSTQCLSRFTCPTLTCPTG